MSNYFGGGTSYQCIILTRYPDDTIIKQVVNRAKLEHFNVEFIEGKRGQWEPYVLVKVRHLPHR